MLQPLIKIAASVGVITTIVLMAKIIPAVQGLFSRTTNPNNQASLVSAATRKKSSPNVTDPAYLAVRGFIVQNKRSQIKERQLALINVLVQAADNGLLREYVGTSSQAPLAVQLEAEAEMLMFQFITKHQARIGREALITKLSLP